jgi:hypothetical protein
MAIEVTPSCAIVLIQSGPTKEDTEVWSWGTDDRMLGRGQGLLIQERITPSLIVNLIDESVVQVSLYIYTHSDIKFKLYTDLYQRYSLLCCDSHWCYLCLGCKFDPALQLANLRDRDWYRTREHLYTPKSKIIKKFFKEHIKNQ